MALAQGVYRARSVVSSTVGNAMHRYGCNCAMAGTKHPARRTKPQPGRYSALRIQVQQLCRDHSKRKHLSRCQGLRWSQAVHMREAVGIVHRLVALALAGKRKVPLRGIELQARRKRLTT